MHPKRRSKRVASRQQSGVVRDAVLSVGGRTELELSPKSGGERRERRVAVDTVLLDVFLAGRARGRRIPDRLLFHTTLRVVVAAQRPVSLVQSGRRLSVESVAISTFLYEIYGHGQAARVVLNTCLFDHVLRLLRCAMLLMMNTNQYQSIPILNWTATITLYILRTADYGSFDVFMFTVAHTVTRM